MKNKKNTYLVLALVAAIWGVVIFRIIDHFRPTDIDELVFEYAGTSAEIISEESTFELSLNYSDPFLKWNASATSVSSGTKKESNKSKGSGIRRRIQDQSNKPVKVAVQWPEISYSGLIKNDNSNELVGLVEVSGNTYLARQGDIFSQVELQHIFADSIIVNFENETKTIKK